MRVLHKHTKYHFIAGCNETYTDKQIVIIFSLGFPSVYTPFHNCVWKITASKPHFYQIEISSFSLNYSPMCKLDYLKISDHANKLALPNNGKLCRLHRKISIVSRTSELTICLEALINHKVGQDLDWSTGSYQKRRGDMLRLMALKYNRNHDYSMKILA